MVFRTLTCAAILACLPALAGAAPEDPVFGYWISERGNTIIQLRPCGEEACGRIVWLENPYDVAGRLRRDGRNEREHLRERLICGLETMGGFERKKPGVWKDGYVYRPEEGRSYSARMQVRGDGELEIRDFVGLPILGSTQVWTRAHGNRGGC